MAKAKVKNNFLDLSNRKVSVICDLYFSFVFCPLWTFMINKSILYFCNAFPRFDKSALTVECTVKSMSCMDKKRGIKSLAQEHNTLGLAEFKLTNFRSGSINDAKIIIQNSLPPPLFFFCIKIEMLMVFKRRRGRNLLNGVNNSYW